MTSFKVVLCHFCESHGPRVLFCSENKTRNQLNMVAAVHSGFTNGGVTGGDLCQACRSVSHPGFVSYTKETSDDSEESDMTSGGQQIIYKSSQFPDSDDDFSHVRQACVKSLSNEVCMGREGCIFFGDSKNGYTFCYTFYLRDSKARGLQRFYSLLAWTRDRYFLVNYWSFFEDNFASIINQLKKMAQKVYDGEEKDTVAVRFQRGIPAKSRSLATLVNCPDVFERLHKQFTWILRNAFNYLFELETPEWLRNTNEDEQFLKELFIEDEPDPEIPAKTQLDELPPELSKLIRFRDIHQLFGRENFIAACVHTLIGNQLIFRGSNQSLVSALINTFSNLIPVGCCKANSWSLTYCESFEANLLGLELSATVPKHVLESDLFVLFDISCDKLDLGTFKCSYISNFSIDKNALPKIYTQFEKTLICDRSFSDSEVLLFYNSLKEEWLGNAQTFYQFVKVSGAKSQSGIDSCMKIIGAENELERMLLRFWLNGLSSKFKKKQLAFVKQFAAEENLKS